MTNTDRVVTRLDARSGIVVRLTPEGVMYREKGRRTWFGPVAYGAAYLSAVRASVEAERRNAGPSRKRRVRRGVL